MGDLDRNCRCGRRCCCCCSENEGVRSTVVRITGGGVQGKTKGATPCDTQKKRGNGEDRLADAIAHRPTDTATSVTESQSHCHSLIGLISPFLFYIVLTSSVRTAEFSAPENRDIASHAGKRECAQAWSRDRPTEGPFQIEWRTTPAKIKRREDSKVSRKPSKRCRGATENGEKRLSY